MAHKSAISAPRPLRRIDTQSDLEAGLKCLLALDPRLEPIAEGLGPLPLRRTRPGFASLVTIVVSQQISRASADAIMARLSRLVDPLAAPELAEAGEDALRAAGLSRPKQRTLLALADAVLDGGLDLEEIAERDPGEALGQLVALHGIGAWTAQVYLLLAAGHPDIFPASDVALQAAVADAFDLPARPTARELHMLAESWSPWRGVAARLFWAHYGRLRGRDVLPPAASTKDPAKSA